MVQTKLVSDLYLAKILDIFRYFSKTILSVQSLQINVTLSFIQ